MRAFKFTLNELKEILQPSRVEGSSATEIVGVASLEKARSGDLAFLGNPRYEKQVATSAASLILLPEKFTTYTPKEGQAAFFVKSPSVAFGLVCERIERMLSPKPLPGIHPSAFVDRDAQVHPEAYIGPMCVIEANAQVHKGAVLHGSSHIGINAIIGADSELKPHVTVLADCEVGKRVILHSGVVIGSDGFGYEFVQGKHLKIPQIGKVIIEDDVELGANTTVDRARFDATRIGQGTKIDNLVQIAHNVTIGKHCIIVAQVAIAGSSTLEDYVVIGGQAAVGGHLTVGTQSQIAAQSGVNSSLPPKSFVTGNPAYDFKKAYRVIALSHRLPEIFKRVENLESHLGIEKEKSE